MLEKFVASHEIVTLLVVVILNAFVSIRLSKKPYRKEAAFASWMFTIFLGLMWIVAIVIYFI